jgi:hypothetical protein
MKTKIIVACLATALAITVIACNWLSSKPTAQAINVEGKWSIDSIDHKGSDSSKNVGNLILALTAKDSLPIGIQFNNDSSFQYLNVADTSKGKYSVSADTKRISLQQDSVTTLFDIIDRSDSLMSFASPDSTIYYLKRK